MEKLEEVAEVSGVQFLDSKEGFAMWGGFIGGAAIIVYGIYLGTRAIDDRLEKVCDLLVRIEDKLDDIRTDLQIKN